MSDERAFSRPFKGFDWAVHPIAGALINQLLSEMEDWWRTEQGGERFHSDKYFQHLNHFVLEAYRTYKAHPKLYLGIHHGEVDPISWTVLRKV